MTNVCEPSSVEQLQRRPDAGDHGIFLRVSSPSLEPIPSAESCQKSLTGKLQLYLQCVDLDAI